MQRQRAQTASSVGSSPTRPTIKHTHAFIQKGRFNEDYDVVEGTTKYKHVEIWRSHHGQRPDPKVYVVHHKDCDKKNNTVCDRPAPCPVLDCGNLAIMTRADHIREHKPGKMSGQKGLIDTRPRKRRGAKR